MSCNCPPKSDPAKVYIGVLDCGPRRTKRDIEQQKQFCCTRMPVKEPFCNTCNWRRRRRLRNRPHRSLAFDDSHNPLSYNTQFHHMS